MNYLMDQDGDLYPCIGIRHEVKCKILFGRTLKQFLKTGVRIMDHRGLLAIETKKELTKNQKCVINRILRDGEYYCLITDIGNKYNRKESFKRIKRI